MIVDVNFENPDVNVDIKNAFDVDIIAVGLDGANYVTPEMFGAKGDGTTDDTEAIQNALESSNIVKFGNKTYLVSKCSNSALYPNGDEPCLYLNNRENVYLYGDGAKLKVDTHGQGILEIINSHNVTISGITFEGYGQFPKLDTNSGRGEKGTTGEGYFDTAHSYQFSLYKNNSVDTSAYTGFGANASETWGTFGNGYIGNTADGILIYGGCSNINIYNCAFSGFNHNGVEVGSRTVQNYNYSKHIVIDSCEFKNIYDGAVQFILCDGGNVTNCWIHDIGHPDAFPSDGVYAYEYADPGYGVACAAYQSGSTTYRARNISVENNHFEKLIRKGIDSHTCNGMIISGNTIKTVYAFGINILMTNASQVSDKTIISGNMLEDCGQKGTAIDVYAAQKLTDNTLAVVSENIIRNCVSISTYGLINIKEVIAVCCDSNIIENSNGGFGIAVIASDQISVADNVVKGCVVDRGLFIYYSDVSAHGNIFDTTSTYTYEINHSSGTVHDNQFINSANSNTIILASVCERYSNYINGLSEDGESIRSLLNFVKQIAIKESKSGTNVSYSNGIADAPMPALVVNLPYQSSHYGNIVVVKSGNNLINTQRKRGYLTSDPIREWDENCYYLGIAYNNVYSASAEDISSYSADEPGLATVTSYGSLGVALPVRCTPNTSYYIKSDKASGSKAEQRIAYYTTNGEYLGNSGSSQVSYSNFTTPANCGWAVICIGINSSSVLTAYRNNMYMCISTDYSSATPQFVGEDSKVYDIASIDSAFYGGTLDTVNGILTSQYDSAGNALATPKISNAPIWGAASYGGYNLVFSDSGTVSVDYIVDTKAYIDAS